MERNAVELNVELLDVHAETRVLVRLKGCYSVCTLCGELKPMSEFGLRHMGGGVIRNQAQCSPCRSERGKE